MVRLGTRFRDLCFCFQLSLLLLTSSCEDDTGTGAAGGSPAVGGGGGGSTSDGLGGSGGAECGCIEHASCDAMGACVCDEGWKGDGSICIDLDECFEHADDCAESAECRNLDGSFECACPAGTVGDPKDACTTLYDQVSSRSVHTCARRSDGALFCFGSGSSGRLGNGLTAHQAAPVRVGASDNWLTVEAGGAHSCGIKDTGTLWCWGSNGFGQLGLGHLDGQTLPAWIDLTRSFTSVAVGESHSCAVESTGQLFCFGRNATGQLGDGTTTDRTELTPVSVEPGADPPEDDWARVFANRDNTCGLKTSGQLYCWGRNTDKQIREAAGNVSTPFAIETAPGAADADWIEAATGSSTCALKSSGELYCWGRNAEGQLADGSFTPSGTPKLVEVEAELTHVRMGVATVCALDAEGGAFCWGRNTAGQIAPGGAAYLTAPTPTAFAPGARDLTVGASHVCAVDAEQRLSCMGSGTFGETGQGQLGMATVHGLAQTVSSKAIAAYGESSCVISSADDLQCWGIGDVGQLGVGDTASVDVPKDVAQTVKIKAVALGRKHACEITTTGSALRCAGSNANGQLGTNQSAPTTSFNPITTAGKPWGSLSWSKLAAGESHNCAISSTSALWCWGRNAEGQLGQTAAPALGDLVHVTTTDNWTSVALGAFHSCGRRSDGTLWCWGRNSSGEVGNGTLDATSLPFSQGAGWTGAIAAGVNHTCAIKTPGELYCWGENGNSQLGDGTTVDRLTPTRIGMDSDWVDVAAANAFSCARKSSGVLYCWGADTTGQLGVGDVATRTRPTQIAGDLTFGSLALGYAHACGRVADGAVHCWGTSELGQLGRGGAWGYAPAWVVEP